MFNVFPEIEDPILKEATEVSNYLQTLTLDEMKSIFAQIIADQKEILRKREEALDACKWKRIA